MLKAKINILNYLLKLFKDTKFLLIIIFSLSVWIRFLGVYPGFPPNHPDEPTIYGSVKQLFLFGQFKPVLYSYGGLLYELYSLVIALIFIPLSFIFFFFSNPEEIILKGAAGFMESYRHSQLLTSLNFLYWTRYLTAILGSLTVVTVYLLGKKLFDKPVGLLAAFFIAVNYRHVLSSVLVLADAPAGFFASLSVLLSVYLIKKPTVKAYLLAGFALGLGLSVKYFIYILPTFLLCHFIGVITNSNKSFFKKIAFVFISKKLLLALSICLTTFFTINSFILFDFNTFFHEYQYDSVRFGVTNPIAVLLKYDYHRSLVGLYYLVRFGIGEWLTGAIVVGIIYSLFRKTKSTLILMSVIVPFLVVFIMIAAPSSARYYTAVIPFLLLFPAFLIVAALRFMRTKTLKVLLFIVVMLVFVSPSVKNSYLTSLYFSQPQNQVVSLKWLEDNLPRDSTVAASGVFLPLAKNIKEVDISPVGASALASIGQLKENKIEWVAVSSHYTSLVNSQYWISSGLVQNTFFDDNLFWEMINNTYTSLELNEVGAYRVKEFLKPFWQSPDRAVFIAKVPKSWQIKKDRLILEYNFDRPSDRKAFSKSSLVNVKLKNILFSEKAGYPNLTSLLLDTVDCGVGARAFSNNFTVEKDKWYSIVGFAKRMHGPSYNGQHSGFFRLDFYSKDDKRIRTYVTGLIDSDENWQELSAAGFAPRDAKYGTISFQIDNCFPGEEYFVNNLKIFVSDSMSPVNTKEYPYYGKQIPKNFLWLPEL